MTENFIMIFVTTKDKQEAEKISQSLLNDHLVACANIISPVNSFFHWQGDITEAEECLVIMKTRLDLFSKIVEQIKNVHSYEVPEILALPIMEGYQPYFDWMRLVLKPGHHSHDDDNVH